MASIDTLTHASIPVTTRSSGRRRKPVTPFDEVSYSNTKTRAAANTTKRQPPRNPSVTLEDYTQKQLEKLRKRPAKTSTNAAIVRKVFGDCATMELAIPVVIDDYNGNMNGVDLANQLRSVYDTQRMAYRTWLPLFYWILDQSAINAYILAKTKGTWKKDKHLEFRRELYTKLLAYSDRLNPPKHRDAVSHHWVVFDKRRVCGWCSKLATVKREVKATVRLRSRVSIAGSTCD